MASLSEADQLLLKNNPSLSTADIKSYNVKKTQLFKLTIVICAIYGTLALTVLLLTLFSAKGSQIFTEEIRPFTLTFVGGMILVIILLIIQIITFKPQALTTSVYDKDSCPDFWKLVATPINDPVYLNANSNIKSLFKYQCVPDYNYLNTYRSNVTISGNTINPYGQIIASDYITTSNVYIHVNNTNNDLATSKLIGATGLNGYLTQFNPPSFGASNLQCNKVFPNYLAITNMNDADLQTTPNALSCAYAKACGIPWTSQCGN